MKSPVIKHPCSGQTVGIKYEQKKMQQKYYFCCKSVLSVYMIVTAPLFVKYFNIRKYMIMYGYHTIITKLCKVMSVRVHFFKGFQCLIMQIYSVGI